MKLVDAVTEAFIRCERLPPGPFIRATWQCCRGISEDDLPTDVVVLFLDAFADLLALFPPDLLVDRDTAAQQLESFQPTLTVPLYDLLPIGKAVMTLGGVFFYRELMATGLFSELRQQLTKNENIATGVTSIQRILGEKQIPEPDELGLSPYEMVEAYCRYTPLYDFFTTAIPLTIPRARFNEHGFLFARSGFGKTQALRTIVAQFLTERDPPALFLIDSLGALIKGIEELEVFDTTLKDRLLILDPSRPQYMPRLNFFGLQSDDMLFYLFKSIEQSFTPRQATLVSYLMEYMRATENPSLLKLIQLCRAKQLDEKVLGKLSPFAQEFFETEFLGKGDKYVQDTKSQIAQRLFTLGRLGTFTNIFDNTRSNFDPYQCMQSKKIVLINTDARSSNNGGLGAVSPIFGRYILALCLEAARERPENQRHLALIICDEAKAYLDEQSALILSDARQYGMGMMLASQQPHQLPEGVRREVNTNTSVRFMGDIENSIASHYSADMRTTPEFIRSMKKVDYSHADWAVYISGMDKAMRVRCRYGVLEKMPKRKLPTAPERIEYQQNLRRAGDLVAGMAQKLIGQMPEKPPIKDEEAFKSLRMSVHEEARDIEQAKSDDPASPGKGRG